MGRPLRHAPGGLVYHAFNRANARLPIFHKDGDYEAFERILAEALEHVPGMRLLTYCLMPNHWHLVLWPTADGELPDFCHWLTLTHTQRWHAHYRDVGAGHLYQGRYKSSPVETDEHFLTLCRYVERNPVRANLAPTAQDWRWSGVWARLHGLARPTLTAWPVKMPRDYLAWVNRPLTEKELDRVRQAVRRGQPYGGERWVEQTAKALNLQSTLRPRGRPRKPAEREKGS